MKQLSGMAGAVTSARFQPNDDHFQAELSTFQELILPKKLSKKKKKMYLIRLLIQIKQEIVKTNKFICFLTSLVDELLDKPSAELFPKIL